MCFWCTGVLPSQKRALSLECSFQPYSSQEYGLFICQCMHFSPVYHSSFFLQTRKKKAKKKPHPVFLERQSKPLNNKSADWESILSPSTTLFHICLEVKPVQWAFALYDRLISNLSSYAASQATLSSGCMTAVGAKCSPWTQPAVSMIQGRWKLPCVLKNQKRAG